jgi:hypothetical protein
MTSPGTGLPLAARTPFLFWIPTKKHSQKQKRGTKKKGNQSIFTVGQLHKKSFKHTSAKKQTPPASSLKKMSSIFFSKLYLFWAPHFFVSNQENACLKALRVTL